MSPEVKASIIIVANEWAMILTKLSPPPKGQFIDRLADNLRKTYHHVLRVVEEVDATSG
jgi:hypothetical protein